MVTYSVGLALDILRTLAGSHLPTPRCWEQEHPLAEWKLGLYSSFPCVSFPVSYQGGHGVRAGGFVVVIVVVLENEKNKCSSFKVSV